MALGQAKVHGAVPPRWALYHSNTRAWEAVFAACEEAAQSIAIEQYIISGSGIGARLLDVLTGRARAGVRVRVLADGYGSFGLTHSGAGRTLRAAGGEMAMYNSMRAMLFNPVTHLRRLHRKTVICDGDMVMAGGTCFRDDMSGWRDTFMQVKGAVGSAALEAFDLAWRGATRQHRDLWPWMTRQVHPAQHSDWSYLPCGPRPLIGRLYRYRLRSEITRATRTITLTTPYLFPPRSFLKALIEAHRRGVRVRILFPARGNHFMMNAISWATGKWLRGRGITVHAYEPAMMHAKIALIDGSWASVGSFNLDRLSFLLNLENGVGSRSPGFCAALGEQLERDFAQGSAL